TNTVTVQNANERRLFLLFRASSHYQTSILLSSNESVGPLTGQRTIKFIHDMLNDIYDIELVCFEQLYFLR
ncbi:hypothetical protein, partial [Paenibacillus macquariensis]|uniref:hypothetical protein n=1 Tax=Paenibacillus macquariensis TaxID=948756 RepID=UPI002DB788E9